MFTNHMYLMNKHKPDLTLKNQHYEQFIYKLYVYPFNCAQTNSWCQIQ